MKCKKARKLILLGQAAEDEVAEHLRVCDECRWFLDAGVRMEKLGSSDRGRDLAPDKIARIRNEAGRLMEQRAKMPRSVLVYPRFGLAAAAAVAILLAGAWLVQHTFFRRPLVSTDRPSRPVEGVVVAQAFPSSGLDGQIDKLSDRIGYDVGSFAARHASSVARSGFDSRLAVLRDRVEWRSIDIAKEIGNR